MMFKHNYLTIYTSFLKASPQQPPGISGRLDLLSVSVSLAYFPEVVHVRPALVEANVSVFAARRHASAVYAVIVCQSVCLSVCHKSVFY